jgi:hypothetical protein
MGKKAKVKVISEIGLPDTILLPGGSTPPMFKLQWWYSYSINNKVFSIPPGFIFDYMSIPRVFWFWLFPINSKTAPASLLHDIGYAGRLWDRKYCDLLFLSCLRYCGIGSDLSYLVYMAVRIGGGRAYRKNDRLHEVRELLKINDTPDPYWCREEW